MGKATYLLMTLAGVFGFSAGVSPAVRVVSMLSKLGSAPIEATVAGAPAGRWVTLTDAKLRCETRTVYKDATTFFLATDAALANPFVAQFLGTPACEAASASLRGAFLPETLTLADLAHFGIDAKGATGLRQFAPISPEKLRVALVPLAAVVLLGGGITAWGIRGLLRKTARRP